MDIHDLYNRIYDGRNTLLRPTTFIMQVEACPGFAELDLPTFSDEKKCYFRLLTDYGISLYAVCRYELAVSVLTRVISLVEDVEVEDVWQNDVYEQALLYRCHALSMRGDKETARRDAVQLLEHCPDELQYRHLIYIFEVYFRTQSYRRVNTWALSLLFVGLLIAVIHPADPSVRFMGHILGNAGVVCGMVNYGIWKYGCMRWKEKQKK